MPNLMENYITIKPVAVWTASGTKSASLFEVRYVNYQNGPAVADTHLWTADADGKPETEVGASLVNATAEQTAAWDGNDDVPFYKALAQNAGLSPA